MPVFNIVFGCSNDVKLYGQQISEKLSFLIMQFYSSHRTISCFYSNFQSLFALIVNRMQMRKNGFLRPEIVRFVLQIKS